MMRNRLVWVVCGLLIIGGGYWLWSRGVANLPAYAMLLLCPLMHLFMHGGHGGHGKERGQQGAAEQGRGGESGASCH